MAERVGCHSARHDEERCVIRRRYYSGQLMPPPDTGAELSDDEFEVLLALESMRFSFEEPSKNDDPRGSGHRMGSVTRVSASAIPSNSG